MHLPKVTPVGARLLRVKCILGEKKVGELWLKLCSGELFLVAARLMVLRPCVLTARF